MSARFASGTLGTLVLVGAVGLARAQEGVEAEQLAPPSGSAQTPAPALPKPGEARPPPVAPPARPQGPASVTAPPPPGAPRISPGAAEGAAPAPRVPLAGTVIPPASPPLWPPVPSRSMGATGPRGPTTPPPTVAPPAPRSRWTWATPVAPGADDVQETGKEVSARVPWRGTALAWSHNTTTSAVGVGADYQSNAHQVYRQGLSLIANYYLYSDKGWRWRVSTSLGMDVELTNSNSTTTRREPILRDIPITTVVSKSIYRPHKESLFNTIALANFTATIPTSKYTAGAGDRLTLSPRVTLLQVLPLAGKEASFLKSGLVGVGFRYDHRLTQATVAVSDNVTSVPRQTTAPGVAGSDVLSGGRVAPDTLRASAFALISEKLGTVPTQLFIAGFYGSAQLHGLDDALPSVEQPAPWVGRSSRPSAGVSAGLTFFPVVDFGISLGYSNQADLDSEVSSIWYTPSATFGGTLVVSIDAIYERMTGPARTVPFVLF